MLYDERAENTAAFVADPTSLLHLANRLDEHRPDADDPEKLSAGKVYEVLDAFVGLWPKVPLPSSHGTGSPSGEKAYRFLRALPWKLNRDEPEAALAFVAKLSADPRFVDFGTDLLAIRAIATRRLARKGYRLPRPRDISTFLEDRSIATVEDMRALMIDALSDIEKEIRHSETDTLEVYYDREKHVDENRARNRLVEHLRTYVQSRSLTITIEHHMHGGKRSDITVGCMIRGKRHLLPLEVKGQWHPELFDAAATQLNERYATNPDASQQGVYIVLWFGGGETVAGKKNVDYSTPEQLQQKIVATMPMELRGMIDVKTIDLSRS